MISLFPKTTLGCEGVVINLIKDKYKYFYKHLTRENINILENMYKKILEWHDRVLLF